MKTGLIALGMILLAGALLFGAMQLTAPTTLPNADAQTFARANQMYEKGQYAAAVNLYQQLVTQGVENADVYYNLGRAAQAAGDAKLASDAFAQAYTLAPRDEQIVQAAHASGGMFPALTQNEIVLAAMGLVALLAVLVVTMHRRPAQAQQVA